MLVLHWQDCTDQSLNRGVFGKDAHHAGAAFVLLVDALEQVVAPNLSPGLVQEVAQRQYVLAGLGHELSRSAALGAEHGSHLLPLLLHCLFAVLSENRAQGQQPPSPGEPWVRSGAGCGQRERSSAASNCPGAFVGSR